jgi:hypothetical protein
MLLYNKKEMGDYCVSCGKKMREFTKTVCHNKVRHLKCQIEYEARPNWYNYPKKYNNETGELNKDFNEKYLIWARTPIE